MPNLLDFVLILLILGSAALAWRHGLYREVVQTVVLWSGSAFIMIWLAPALVADPEQSLGGIITNVVLTIALVQFLAWLLAHYRLPLLQPADGPVFGGLSSYLAAGFGLIKWPLLLVSLHMAHTIVCDKVDRLQELPEIVRDSMVSQATAAAAAPIYMQMVHWGWINHQKYTYRPPTLREIQRDEVKKLFGAHR